MGGLLSKRPSMRRDPKVNGGGATRSSAAQTGIQQYTAELSSYEEACRLYPELQSFDATVQQRTSHAIYTLTQGVELGSLSFDTLRKITDGILETNQEVVHFLLECKKDIWKNPELFELVDDYFNCSIQTLDYCTELEGCLRKARDSQLIIHFALQRFEEEEEDEEESREEDKTKYIETLKKLRQFKAAGNPFTEEFSQVFHSVYTMQQSMLEKLLLRKRKLDRKLKSVKAWRKVSNMIFVAALAAFIICSIVAAAIAAPPVAAALAAASAIPIGSLGKWVGSLLKRYQDALVEEKELLSWMQIGTCVALKDLDTLRLLVDKLEIHFNSLLENADFALSDEEAVKFAVEEIKKQMELFMNNIEDLGKQVDRCSRYIRKARTVVLQRIMMHPHPHPHPHPK